ncbi:MAG TPA: transglutaminase family protein [Desulfuromonadales bacterium]|nr:transglutaminase family protein [Desulfuromonadales bacterium]
MRYIIEHETVLEYPAPIREHHVELRLTPREDQHQSLVSLRITTEPDAELRSHVDYFGNRVHAFEIIKPHHRLVTRVQAEVENTLTNPFDYQEVPHSAERDWIRTALRATPSLHDFVLSRSPATPALDSLAQSLEFPRYEAGHQLLESIKKAMQWIGETLKYQPGITSVHSTLADVLVSRAGVCQDFAHLLITIVRSWKVPARYVMGYLVADENREQQFQPATHAWTEILLPGRGWTGFDATQQILANGLFIPVACGRDYLDAAPQRGSFKGDVQGSQPQVSLHISEQ